MKTLFTLFISFFISVTCFAQSATLRYNLQEGKAYEMEMKMKTTTSQEVNGMKMDMNMGMTGAITYLVKAKTDAHFDIEMSYTKLEMEMESPMGKMVASSENSDENDIFSKTMAVMKSSPFHLKMTPQGKVIEVTGLDKLYESMFNAIPQLPEEQRMQLVGQIKQAFGEEVLKDQLGAAMAAFPENPVSKGDSWTISTDIDAGFSMKINTIYTYQGTEGNHWLIQGKSEYATPEDAEPMEMNGMKMKYMLKGDMTVDMKCDKSTGWPVESKIIQKMKGETIIEANPQMPEGAIIPIEISAEVVLRGK